MGDSVREGKGVPDMHLPFALAKSEKLTSLEATKRVSPKKKVPSVLLPRIPLKPGCDVRLVPLLFMFQQPFETFRVRPLPSQNEIQLLSRAFVIQSCLAYLLLLFFLVEKGVAFHAKNAFVGG